MDKTADEIAAEEVAAEEARIKAEREAAEAAELAAASGNPDDKEEDDSNGEGDPPAASTGADDEVTISIGDEESPASEDEATAPEWVKELRKNHRETTRRNRELEEQLKAATGAPLKATELGPKPTLEDHDFDGEKFGLALEAWHEKKRAADEEDRKKQDEEKTAKAAWQAKLTAYNEAKAKLKVTGADEAEAVVKDLLSITQQGIILQGAENPALVVVALGKNTKTAKELASIKDPVKFAFAVAKLETKLKIAPKKVPPAPEESLKGNAGNAGAVDSQLDRLRAEAAKTGDYSKVNAHKRNKRQARAA